MLIAALGVAVLVVAIVALRSSRHSTTTQAGSDTRVSSSGPTSPRPSGSRTSRSRSASSSPRSSRSPSGSRSTSAAAAKQPLIVLNVTSVSGLARDAAARFRRAGWTITRYESYRNDIISTAAYYDPSVSDAKAAAEELQREFPTIKRVVPRFPELPPGPVVVVLQTDYQPG